MAGSRGIAIAAIVIVAALLSGCARWGYRTAPQVLPDWFLCSSSPGWYALRRINTVSRSGLSLVLGSIASAEFDQMSVVVRE